MFFFLPSIVPRWLMPRMYCSHIDLLYYPQTFQISPLVSFYEVLAARDGAVYEPSHFRMFQLSPLVVLKRSQQPKVALLGREMADIFCLKMPDFHVTFRDLLHAVNLRHGTDGFTSLPKEGVLRIFSPWKIRRFRPCLNPRIWVPKASTLPLDHRSRYYP